MLSSSSLRTGIRSFLFLSLLLVTSRIEAQSNFQPGQVVNNQGDTLRGLIDRREWDYNPVSINFKTPEGTESVMPVREVAFFRVGELQYERHAVTMTMDKVDLKKLADVERASDISDTVLLLVLQKGPVSLFSFTDRIKRRFFILQPGDTTPQELVYQIRTTAETSEQSARIGFVSIFRNQLKNAALKAGRPLDAKLIWQIDRANYCQSDLLKMVSKINGITPVRAKGQHHIGYYAGAGYSSAAISTSGGNALARNATTDSPSNSVFLLAGLNFGRSTGVSRFDFGLELMYSGAKNHLMSYHHSTQDPIDIDYNFTQTLISESFLVKYNFINKPMIKCHVGTGIRLNEAIYGKNIYTSRIGSTQYSETDFFRLNTFFPSVPIRVGVLLRNKIEVAVTILPPASLNQYTYVIAEKIGYTQVGLNYRIK